MKNLPIGVFDSGLGGLTVVKAISSLLPMESIIYYGDLAHLPYGSKGQSTVRKLSLDCADFLNKKGIKLLVVACNTASSIALKDIQAILDIPVIGVVEPGAEESIVVSQGKRIGVIGTTRTIVSNSYFNKINDLSPECRVFQSATPLLVPLIEEGWIGHPAFYLILNDYLKFFDDKEIDTLVLGCTHYPLIKEAIKSIRPQIQVVDSAQSTANQVKKVLEKTNTLTENKKPEYQFFASDISETFIDLSKKVMGRSIEIKLV